MEKHCVFQHLTLKSLKSIVFFNSWAWNHWKASCFSTFDLEIIEKHCVFKHLWSKWLNKNIVFLNIYCLSTGCLGTWCLTVGQTRLGRDDSDGAGLRDWNPNCKQVGEQIRRFEKCSKNNENLNRRTNMHVNRKYKT